MAPDAALALRCWEVSQRRKTKPQNQSTSIISDGHTMAAAPHAFPKVHPKGEGTEARKRQRWSKQKGEQASGSRAKGAQKFLVCTPIPSAVMLYPFDNAMTE